MSTSKKSEPGIASASSAAKELLTAALKDLKESALADDAKLASTDRDPAARLFFPNGIELISITVKVAPVEIEFKVAGEKGIKEMTMLLDSETAPESMS
jgi:hypothetical protein